MDFAAPIRRAQRRSLDWLVGRFAGSELDRRAESFVSLFQEFIPPSSRVLDIGGGWGFYVEPLERTRNCDVTVLDVVEPAFRKAPVVVYEGETIPFPDRSFEVSLLITVLHHMPNPERVLAEAKRVTRRAVIVVEDLYRTALGRIWTVVRDTLCNLEFVGHPRRFQKREEWLASFRRLGFRVEFEKEVLTSLLGLRILNGIFVLGHAHG